MSKKLIWPVSIILISLIAGLVAWINLAGTFRSLFTFIFILVIPGLAFTRLFKFRDFLTEIILAIALSLVVSTILAEIMVFAHLWYPNAALGILVALSIVGATGQIFKNKHALPRKGG